MSTFEQLQRENDALKQKNQKLEDQLGTLNVEVSTLTGRIETLCAESGDINENPVVVHLQGQNTTLAEQNVKLERALDAAELNTAAMRDARDHMEGKFNDCHAEKQSLKERYTAVQMECKRLQQWNDQLETANDTLRTENAVNAGLVQRNTELAERNAELEKERDKWYRMHNHMCTRNSEIWDARVQLEKRGATRSDELEDLRDTNTKLVAEVEAQKERIIDLQVINRDYKAAAQHVEAEHQKHLAEKEAAIEKLHIELNGALFQQHNLKAKGAEANEEQERHQKQKLEVLTQLQAAEKARDAAVKKVETLQQDLRDANAINTNLMKDKARLVKEVTDLCEAKPVTDTETELRKALDKRTHEGRITRYALEYVMTLYDAETDRVHDARTEATELRRDLKHAKTLADERWTGYKKALEDRDDARKERKSLRKRLEQAQTEVKDLRALCDTLSEKNTE